MELSQDCWRCQNCRNVTSRLLRSQPKLVRRHLSTHLSLISGVPGLLAFCGLWMEQLCDCLPAEHCSRAANTKVFSKYALFFPQWNAVCFDDYGILASITSFPVVIVMLFITNGAISTRIDTGRLAVLGILYIKCLLREIPKCFSKSYVTFFLAEQGHGEPKK